MKNSRLNRDQQNDLPEDDKNFDLNSYDNTNFSSKAAKHIMTQQAVTPPARVWERIEKILDEQDQNRNFFEKDRSTGFADNIGNKKRKNIYLAAVAGASVVAGLIWIIA